MFVQSVGLQCASSLLFNKLFVTNLLEVCSWKGPNLRLKVLIAIVQQI